MPSVLITQSYSGSRDCQKPKDRIAFETWYNNKFGMGKLETAHAFGAWYGWKEAKRRYGQQKAID